MAGEHDTEVDLAAAHADSAVRLSQCPKIGFAGKERRISLGVYPDVPLAAAREKREEARRQVAAGIDPGEQRKAALAPQPVSHGPLADLLEWQALAEGAYSPNTLRAQKADGAIFQAFCQSRG